MIKIVEIDIFSDLDDCNYSIKFIPKEMGVHTVSVKHKDMHIPGSPFGKILHQWKKKTTHRFDSFEFHLEFTVGPIQGGGAHKVRASGNGLIRGEVNVTSKRRISVDSKELTFDLVI